ncbi:MAG: hypothetical protein ABI663_11005 [Chryseolinea sp.]
MEKIYDILLDEKVIGTTQLEKADPPMGMVFGRIDFLVIDSGYNFFKEYCTKNKIEFTDHPEDKLILTRTIPNMKVLNSMGDEIKGQGCNISGMDSDEFEVNIEFVPYPFYGEEFPHHVKEYEDRF